MAVGTVTVEIFDRSWTSQGTITSAFLPKGSFLRNDAGDGSFVFPIYDTPAKTLVQYNRIAVVTVEESGSQTAVVAAFHIQHIVPRRISGGGYDGYVVDVSGEGILSELQWDNIGYTTISDGSQGATTSWLSTLLGFTQASWTVNGLPTGTAYLQAAGETVWDAMLECISQLGYGVSYAPSFALKTTGTKGRWILFVETPVSGLGILDWDNLDLVKTGATGDQVEVLDIKPIEDSHESATRVTIYGAGIGADVFTITEAEGLVTVPSGFSVDWTNSVITNDTLEAATDQPIIHRLHQLGHIKPEDNTNTIAIETAAIQLFWAGIAFLRDRQATRRQFYEVTFIGNPGYNYAVMQLANLVYAETSPIDAAGASNTTNVINVSDDFVVHEMHIQVPNSGPHRGLRVITMVLGEQISSEAYIRPLPNDSDIVVKKLKEHDEVLRHATASYAPTSPGGTPTYATADAPFVVISNTTNLTNERAFVAGAGLAAVDGGANGNYTVNVVAADTSLTINADSMQVRLATNSGLTVSSGLALGTPSTVGSGSSNGVTTTTHTHALSVSVSDLPAAITGAAYVMIGNNANFSAERSLVAGAGLLATDGGVNGNYTIDIVAANTSMTINADSIQVRLATNSGMTVSSGLTLGTPTTVSVSTSNAVTTTTHSHAAQSDSTVTTATAVLMATDSNGRTQIMGMGLGTAATGTGVLDVLTKIYINETADANVTTGIVLNQGTADDIAVSFKSSDVAQGATDRAEADNWGYIKKFVATGSEGGLLVEGLTEGNRAVGIVGTVTSEDTAAFSTATVGAVEIRGHTISGTSVATMSGTAAVFIVKNNTGTKFVVDGNGNIHMDATSNINAWDDEDDLALITGLRGSLVPELRERYGEMVRQMRPILEAGNIAAFNDQPGGDGSIFLNIPNALFLTMDGLRQVYERVDGRLQRIEKRLLLDA